MAFNNAPLGDAGRDYYAQQFDGRIQNIRQPGARPPSGGSRGNGTRGAIGGGVLALFVLIRILIGCAGAGSSSFDSRSSSSYDDTPPPTIELPPPPPVPFNNGPDDAPWRRDPGGLDNPGVEQPNDPPGIPDPDAGEHRNEPDKDR